MGHAVVAALGDFPDLELMARVGHRTAESVRFDACDVVIDFALASATEALMTRLEGTRTALVTGVTARTEAQEALIEARSQVAPLPPQS